jgi:formylglycine-generating enzyme required for sulfatase activity
MVKIPGGELVLRDDRINRVWSVKIEPFLISKFPVTQKLYFENTGCSLKKRD